LQRICFVAPFNHGCSGRHKENDNSNCIGEQPIATIPLGDLDMLEYHLLPIFLIQIFNNLILLIADIVPYVVVPYVVKLFMKINVELLFFSDSNKAN